MGLSTCYAFNMHGMAYRTHREYEDMHFSTAKIKLTSYCGCSRLGGGVLLLNQKFVRQK